MSPLRRIYNYTTRRYEFIPVASGAPSAAAAAANLEITENTITYKRAGGSSNSIENIQKDLLDAVLLLEKHKSSLPPK